MGSENLDLSKLYSTVELSKPPRGLDKDKQVMVVCTKWLRRCGSGYVCFWPASNCEDHLIKFDDIDYATWRSMRVRRLIGQSDDRNACGKQQQQQQTNPLDATADIIVRADEYRPKKYLERNHSNEFLKPPPPQKKMQIEETSCRQVDKFNVPLSTYTGESSRYSTVHRADLRASTPTTSTGRSSTSILDDTNGSGKSQDSMLSTSRSRHFRQQTYCNPPDSSYICNRERLNELAKDFLSADEARLEETIKPLLLHAIATQRQRTARLTKMNNALKAKMRALECDSGVENIED